MQLLLKLFFPLEQTNINLQCKSKGLHEAQAMIALLKVSLTSYREQLSDFWAETTATAKKINIDEPILPRQGRAPRRLDDCALSH